MYDFSACTVYLAELIILSLHCLQRILTIYIRILICFNPKSHDKKALVYVHFPSICSLSKYQIFSSKITVLKREDLNDSFLFKTFYFLC